MREKVFFAFLFLIPSFIFAQTNSWKIDDLLRQRMESAPDQLQEVLIELADQEDTHAMLATFERDHTPLQQRSYEVITRLQAKAAATQPIILSRLKTMEGIDQSAIYPLWINNSIYILAKPEAIAQIAEWPEINALNWNSPVELDGNEVGAPAPPVPNGSETGLRAIKAPFMWNMGYTGYGHKALIIDTGDDGDHPALIANFWGNYVPKNQAWNGTGYPEDCGDHGTHVTGTVVGLDRKTNDTIGVAYNAQWMGAPMQFGVGDDQGCQRAFTQTVFSNYNSFQWSLNPDGNTSTNSDQPDVINCSWRSGNFGCGITQATNALNACEAAGIAVVFSQGNDGPAAGTVTSGGAMNMDLVNTFAIGAVDAANASFPIADFSSRGPTPCGGTGSLLIKPEVCAPGVNVRSAFNGGVYQSINGTSMASPHVSGAIVLLKEAFPSLSGIEIKLSLYNSANDLGAVGEDNTYGKGMINLEDAYNYLINAGHTPVAPTPAEREAIVLDIEIKGDCIGPVNPFLVFENAGSEIITSLTVSYGIAGGSTQTYDWSGAVNPNNYVSVPLPPVTGVLPGTYTLTAEITSVNGVADDRPLNNKFKKLFTMANDEYAAATVNQYQVQPACSNSRVLLEYATDLTAAERVQWYATASSSVPLAEGNSFLTPELTQSTNYYVTTSASYKGGKTDLPVGGNNSASVGGAMTFDVLQDMTLKTVKVYAPDAGARVLRLYDNTGQELAFKAVVLSQIGEQRVSLNFKIPKGTGYKLELQGSKTLQTTSTTPGYPHTIPGVFSLVRGVTPAGSNTTLIYYYFFDWELDVPMVCGRTEVPVNVTGSGTGPVVSFTSADTLVLSNTGDLQFDDASTDVASRYWDFGNGTSSTDASPTATYTVAGTYLVRLFITNAAGCSNVAEKKITVLETSGTFNPPTDATIQMVVYPNPAQDRIHLVFAGDKMPQNATVKIFDVNGKLLLTDRVNGGSWNGNIGQLSAGVYFLQVQDKAGRVWTERFVH